MSVALPSWIHQFLLTWPVKYSGGEDCLTNLGAIDMGSNLSTAIERV